MRNLIAILRGVRPDEVLPIVECLLDIGISSIEVPMNSPEPLESIGQIVKTFSGQGQFGAGTVLEVAEVEAVAALNADFIVSPNCNEDVIRATRSAGLQSYPGVMTPSECFTALHAGASALKFFPGDLIKPQGLKAIRAVLPATTPCYAVGGASAENFAQWIQAGATGFGIGSALYKAGDSLQTVRQNAELLVQAYDQAVAGKS